MQSAALLSMCLAKLGLLSKSFNAYQSGMFTNSVHGDALIENWDISAIHKEYLEVVFQLLLDFKVYTAMIFTL